MSPKVKFNIKNVELKRWNFFCDKRPLKKFLVSLFFLLCDVLCTNFFDNFDTDVKTSPNWTYWTLNSNPGNIKAESPISDPQTIDGKVLQLTFPANDSSDGPIRGPNIQSKQFFKYGIYKARMKSASNLPSSDGIVSAFFTYYNASPADANNNGIHDVSEIDIELLNAEKNCIYLTIWTDYQANPERFRKVTRKINLVTGDIFQTPPGREHTHELQKLTQKISPTVPNFDHSANYYEYSFHWSSTSIRFFILIGTTTIELWNYTNLQFIPTYSARIMFNLWHNAVHWDSGLPANPPSQNAIFKIDWVEYTEFSNGSLIAPTNLQLVSVSPTQVNISWQDNSNNEEGFRIERRTGLTGTYSQIGTVSVNITTYTDTHGLTQGATYYYRVCAYNVRGNSAYSNEIKVVIPVVSDGTTPPTVVSPVMPRIILTPNDDGTNDIVDFTKAKNDNTTYVKKVIIYTVQGGVIKELNAEPFRWDGKGCSSGVYIYQLEDKFGRLTTGTILVIK